MPRFTRKAGPVTADQFFGDFEDMVIPGMLRSSMSRGDCALCGDPNRKHGLLRDSSGAMTPVHPGDWVVVDGECVRVVRPADFAREFVRD